ncbi:beta-ketoacyl-[acyl-carrier-protein] synthase family protein [Flammeovirgaceae bacterium SG7u.111]|nr:beta-ketoacyl-[acyl-carrier-protein] synthase family protein [Flammeovirgaceae bacterium SG7u.132]WPO36159.1 beta-ketoacyl-[acyl-carrier-protein] synthase family protein [Flammeovirgaceae bacterium SG7u.111]
MAEKIVVTGIGIISALGLDTQENLAALSNQKTGIGHSARLVEGLPSEFLFGEVKASNEQLAATLLSSQHHNSRTALLGLKAASEALKSASLNSEMLGNFGLVNGTSVGGMDVSEIHYSQFAKGESIDFQAAFGTHDCGFSAELIADTLGIKKHISTISTACSSSANSIAFAADLIKQGKVDGALAGGTDALSYFTFHGFNSLMILDKERCKPFDEQRKGLNLGEGAAFLVLESENSALKRGATILAEVAGYANASDAYHQTASSPEGTGATLAIRHALDMAGISAEDISYINAHGTGTENNDLSESIAIKNIFGDTLPPYSSTKSFTGHTLGAAGGIEAVFSVLAISQGIAFANQKITQPMEVLSAPPLQQIQKKAGIKHVLSNSFGFGGNCSSLLFSKA